jgi:hypothetical protein
VERLIGSIRRECLDHIVVTGEPHLRHILQCYMEYYNAVRTHLSLRMRRFEGSFSASGASKVDPCLADYTINTYGFNLRQGQVKRTWPIAVQMSAFDPKRTSDNLGLKTRGFSRLGRGQIAAGMIDM